MAGEHIEPMRSEIDQHIAALHSRGDRLSPLDIHARMDAIRQAAADNGLDALEGLMRRSAQLTLLPGHRVATQCCLEHLDEALQSRSSGDRTTILAALALRLR